MSITNHEPGRMVPAQVLVKQSDRGLVSKDHVERPTIADDVFKIREREFVRHTGLDVAFRLELGTDVMRDQVVAFDRGVGKVQEILTRDAECVTDISFIDPVPP